MALNKSTAFYREQNAWRRLFEEEDRRVDDRDKPVELEARALPASNTETEVDPQDLRELVAACKSWRERAQAAEARIARQMGAVKDLQSERDVLNTRCIDLEVALKAAKDRLAQIAEQAKTQAMLTRVMDPRSDPREVIAGAFDRIARLARGEEASE